MSRVDLHLVKAPAVADPVADARRVLAEAKERQARALETAIADLIELAEQIAGADSLQDPGVRDVARVVAMRLKEQAGVLACVRGRK